MKIRLYHIAAAMAGMAMMSGCGKNDAGWTVEGSVEGADEAKLYLEAFNNNGNNWYVLDTVRTDHEGKFSITSPRAAFPDVYRITLDGKSVYFPIDSTETITVKSKAGAFSTDYSVEGSDAAATMLKSDKLINDYVASHGVAALDSAVNLKRELSGMILGDMPGIASYYLVTKRINGKPVFNPLIKSDMKIIGAVANAYSEFRPNDPRAEFLKRLYIEARKLSGTTALSADTLVATEIDLIDIELPDASGKKVKLSDVAAANKVVILNFTDYSADYSQPLNIALRKTYDQYHNNGLEIYQIGISPDEYQWRMAARNQPWTTVYYSTNLSGKDLMNYNVGSLPAMFIISNGALSERISDINSLSGKITGYINR